MSASTDSSNNPSFNKRHRHKRSFALSGDNNFDFLPSINNRKNSNSSLPEFINTGNKNGLSNNSPVIDFDNAEKYIQQSNTTQSKKESILRHKRSESAPTEMLSFNTIEDDFTSMNGNWLDLSNTTSEDQIKKYWDNNYSTVQQDLVNEPCNTGTSKNNDLLIEVEEEDENNSGSNNSSPLKNRMSYGVPEKTSTNSMNNSKTVRHISNNSYRSITPSSATSNLSSSSFRLTLSTPTTAISSSSPLAMTSSTTNNTNTNRSIGRTKHTNNFHQRYHNFGIPYSPSASSGTANGTGSSQGSSRVSSANSGDSGLSTDKRDIYNSLKAQEGISGLSPLASEVISKYATMGKKKSNGKMGVAKKSSSGNLNTPFNFRSQEYDISKDLEDLKILDLANDEDEQLKLYLAEENYKKQASISTITQINFNNGFDSGTILDNNISGHDRHTVLDDERKRFSKHSRQYTDTESNITLTVPVNKETKCPDDFEKNLQAFEEESVPTVQKKQASSGSQEEVKSFISEVDNNKKKGSSQNLRSRISSSISFSNLSLKANDVDDNKKIKKSLSIQSLSKFLRPHNDEDNTEKVEGNNKKEKRRRDTSKRQSLMAWIFKSK